MRPQVNEVVLKTPIELNIFYLRLFTDEQGLVDIKYDAFNFGAFFEEALYFEMLGLLIMRL